MIIRKNIYLVFEIELGKFCIHLCNFVYMNVTYDKKNLNAYKTYRLHL